MQHLICSLSPVSSSKSWQPAAYQLCCLWMASGRERGGVGGSSCGRCHFARVDFQAVRRAFGDSVLSIQLWVYFPYCFICVSSSYGTFDIRALVVLIYFRSQFLEYQELELGGMGKGGMMLSEVRGGLSVFWRVFTLILGLAKGNKFCPIGEHFCEHRFSCVRAGDECL